VHASLQMPAALPPRAAAHTAPMASAAAHDYEQLVRRLDVAASAGDVADILALMREGKADAKAQVACCAALELMLVRDAGVLADTTLVAALLEAVFSGLRVHVAYVALMLRARALLLHVLDLPQRASQALAAGGAETMVAVMRAQPDCAAAQSACCQVLNMMAVIFDFGSRAGAAGAVQAVLAALTTHSADKDTQLVALRALRRLMLHKANADQALAAGALEAVLAVLCAHESAGDRVLSDACLTLRDLATSSEAADKASRLGAVRSSVSILQRAALKGNSYRSTLACAALELLVRLSVHARTAAAACGGVEAVLAALRAHPTEASLQRTGWTTLHLLFLDSPNIAVAIHAGALALVVAALREHSANPGVVAAACMTLSTLGLSTESAAAAGQLGAVELIVAGMQAHTDEGSVQHFGCVALAVLMHGCGENAYAARRVGAAHVVQAAVRMHCADDVMVQAGEAVLGMLQRVAGSGSPTSAGGDALQAEHAAPGGASVQNTAPRALRATGSSAPLAVPDGALARIEHARTNDDVVDVVAKLRACPADVAVQMAGFAALNDMFVHAGDVRIAAAIAATAAGAVAAVTAALRCFLAHMGVMEHVCVCVTGLALDDAAEEELARSGTPELLVPLLRNKSATPRALSKVCFALGSICHTAESQAHAGQLGIVEAVIAMLAKHASHASVNTGAAHALAVLLNDCPANVDRAQRAGGLKLMQAALSAHGSDMGLTQHASRLIYLLQQHAASAASAADAAMAELLAQEAAERAAKSAQPAARKSKKKRSGAARAAAADAEASGSGAGLLADVSSASGDAAAFTHDVAAASDDGASAPAASALPPEEAARADAADVVAEAAPLAAATALQPPTLPAPAHVRAAAVFDAASSAAAEPPLPAAHAEHDIDAAAVHDAGTRDAAGASNEPYAAPAATASASAALAHAASAPRLPAPPPYCPPSGAPQLTRCAPPPMAPLSDEAAAAMLPPYLAELRLSVPPQAQHAPLPPPAAAAPPFAALQPRAPSPPPPPVMKECCVCLLDLPQNELHLLMFCGHRCVCAECAAALMARPPASRLCPKCREPVLRAAPVFDE
jgi:hypothetical protein